MVLLRKLNFGSKVAGRPPRRSSVRRSSLLKWKLGLNLESVKLKQVAINSPPMQLCTVCFGVSCSDGLRQLATP